MDLDKLVNAKFLDDSEKTAGCDAGPLPPGCDCICHTPCDFGIERNDYNAESSEYDSNSAKNKVYEMN